ncbi:MAG TPA: TetR/AcrR family transcriptional regulator [Solirubrobacterales bacterium]|nr:TetR/AcrR family transcriptional regulator [Solirubrobacterales bacterium]
MPKKPSPARRPLSRERVIAAAVELADRTGYREFSMRRLGTELGVSPMALYKHVGGREELLDEMVDVVFGELEHPPADEDWAGAMRRRGVSVREALGRHPWAVGLMESRSNPGPENLAHHDAVMGCLREAGFSFEMAVHAYSIQDSYIYGFALQEKTMGHESPEESARAAKERGEASDGYAEYPYLIEVEAALAGSGYDHAAEFEWGLDLILEGLERLRR